ncbi:15429_t:CDS:2, partial [Dentiscutata heterogama]
KEQAKHKTEIEKLICSLQNELKDSQKTNSIVKSLQTQLEDSRAINELLKRNYESLIEENKILRENIRRAELEKGTQLEFVKKLGHEIAMNSGLENDLSKSSLPQVTRNGHSNQISEPIKDSEWTGDNDVDQIEKDDCKSKIITDEIANNNDNKGGTIEESKIGYTSNIVNKHGFKMIKTSMLQGIDASIDNVMMAIKQETINGDLTKNKLTKKCSRTIVMSSKGRGVKTTKNECMAESSDSNQVVKKVKSEIKSEKGIQSIKNVSLTWIVGSLLALLFLHSMVIIFIQTTFFQSRFPLPWLNSPTYNNSSLFETSIWNSSLSNLLNWILSWFNLSNWGSSTWNLPATDIISWDASMINAEALKIGVTTLEFSMGWIV